MKLLRSCAYAAGCLIPISVGAADPVPGQHSVPPMNNRITSMPPLVQAPPTTRPSLRASLIPLTWENLRAMQIPLTWENAHTIPIPTNLNPGSDEVRVYDATTGTMKTIRP